MTSDQEPRYRLVDANGNIVGSLYGKPDGSVAIQETASGADREVTLAPDGTFSAPSVETESVSTDSATVTNDVSAGSLSVGDLDTGRTWQDVSSSRSIDTTETNNTDSEIIVYVTVEADADGTDIGVQWLDQDQNDVQRLDITLDSGNRLPIQTVVKPGEDYRLNSFGETENTSIQRWSEFRP